MAEYHAALTSGKPFDAAADAAKLDADGAGSICSCPACSRATGTRPAAVRRGGRNEVGRLEQRHRAQPMGGLVAA